MSELMQEPLASLLKVSGQGAVLIVLVLAAQWAFRRQLPPRWRCTLWLLVLLRLALPWSVPSAASVFNLWKPFHGPSVSTPAPAVTEGAAASATRPAAVVPGTPADQPLAAQPSRWGRPAGSGLTGWLAVWAAGVLGLGSCLVVTHWRLARRLARQRPLIDAAINNLLEDCKQQMGVHVPATLVETRAVGSPSLFGFVRPRLLLPVGLARSFSPEELRCVFLHELGHVKRHDILLGWLMAGLQLVHWFNPLVWLAFSRLRADRELACDALVLARAGQAEKQRYGQTIIKLLEGFGQPAWAPSLAGAVENRKQLKERIRMIANTKHTNRGPLLALALLAGLGLITLTDAQPAASQLDKDLLGTWVLVGAPGHVGAPPAAGGRFKSFTDTQWSMSQIDPQDGVVEFHHGGSYTLKGDEYVETITFANKSTRDKIGKTHKFRLKIVGDTLSQIGIDNPWQEVWKRVKADGAKPRKLEPTELQGTWRGQEAGAKGTCSLVVSGARIEFHGANSNEWYKAEGSVYDTTPRQLIAVVTDCPMPKYRGTVGYAIYKIEDGTLTLTGNEPGALQAPDGFNALDARTLTFKRQ